MRERHDANVNAKEDWWKLKWIDKTRAAAKTQSQRFKGEEQPRNWFLSHRTSRRKVLAPKIKSKKSEKRWHQKSLSSKIIIKSFSFCVRSGKCCCCLVLDEAFCVRFGTAERWFSGNLWIIVEARVTNKEEIVVVGFCVPKNKKWRSEVKPRRKFRRERQATAFFFCGLFGLNFDKVI